MKIELVDISKNTVTTVTRSLNVEGKKIIYIEYQNENGRVIDEELRDENGYSLMDDSAPGNDVAELLEEIQEMFP